MLHDVSKIDLRVQLLGEWVESPVGVAPTGMQKMAHPVGEVGTAQGEPVGLIDCQVLEYPPMTNAMMYYSAVAHVLKLTPQLPSGYNNSAVIAALREPGALVSLVNRPSLSVHPSSRTNSLGTMG